MLRAWRRAAGIAMAGRRPASVVMTRRQAGELHAIAFAIGDNFCQFAVGQRGVMVLCRKQDSGVRWALVRSS